MTCARLCEFHCACVPRPAVVGGRAPRRVSRRVFNSPQPARTIGRVFDTPSEGHPIPRWGARPSGAAGRPPAASRAPRLPAATRRPVPEQVRRADSARQGRAWQSEGTAKEPPLCHLTQQGDSCVGKVAAGGRAARPTTAGRIYEERQCFVASSREPKGTSQVYPCCTSRSAFDEDYRTARCSIARSSDRPLWMTTLRGRPF